MAYLGKGIKAVLLLLSVPAVLVAVGFLALRAYTSPTRANTPITPLERSAAVTVDLPSGSRERWYSFSASPHVETRVQFRAERADFAFAAELRDSSGRQVALLNSAHLHDDTFIIEPGSERYQLALSAADPEADGKVEVVVDEMLPPTPEPEPLETFCGMISAFAPGVRVYNSPDLEDESSSALMVGAMIEVAGQRRGGWYLADIDGRAGWLPKNAIRLYGACDRVPIVLDPAIPLAPADVEPYIVSLDRDGDSRLRERISYPGDDTRDFVWINVMNMYNQSPANYREIAFVLVCDGVGVENVRWGAPDAPDHRCGEVLTLPFTYEYNLQPVVVTFAEGVEQSYIEYELIAASTNGLMQ